LLLNPVLGAMELENLVNTIRFATCVKGKVVCLWHSQPENVLGVRVLAQIMKMIAAKIVMVRVGPMFIGREFLAD
jgi:hypothetical protein